MNNVRWQNGHLNVKRDDAVVDRIEGVENLHIRLANSENVALRVCGPSRGVTLGKI